MPSAIENYAFVGDLRTAALVGANGSIDWLCAPRFDSGAFFAALLGDSGNGRWLLTPESETVQSRRAYREGSLVLETELQTREGTVRIVDCMPAGAPRPDLVRLVEGVDGLVRMRMELVIRFDYGREVPWVRKVGSALSAVAGPDAVALYTPVKTRGKNLTTIAEFSVSPGDRVPFVLRWFPSHEALPPVLDGVKAVEATDRWWRRWSRSCSYTGPWRNAVVRSLITLKGLTFAPTGGIIAAPTTSLPEQIGGIRNWDYRYSWLRDATFTLYALMLSGYREEACAWRDWLLRAVAGTPAQMQIMYGVAGERRLPEIAIPWLPGYGGSSPVRVGNEAVRQLQLDVYGEVMDTLHYARRSGVAPDPFAWNVQRALVEYLESAWDEPDAGIWEVRGPPQHFTHSKIMAWVAFDRAVHTIERHGAAGPLDRWKRMRDHIHEEVCARAYDSTIGAFTQAYGSRRLDASLLQIPLVGFLPARDPRVVSTVGAIERELVHDGFVLRYRTEHVEDGLPPGEGAFLPCSFWLADNHALMGRRADAEALFERLLALRNDVGLLAEEYDPIARRQLGNFPQAFSHVGLVNTAFNLTTLQPKPAVDRGERRS